MDGDVVIEMFPMLEPGEECQGGDDPSLSVWWKYLGGDEFVIVWRPENRPLYGFAALGTVNNDSSWKYREFWKRIRPGVDDPHQRH